MLWAASRGVWVSARPAHGWEAGRRFRLLISSAEGAASWAAARAGGRGGWSLAWRDKERSEQLGSWLVFLHLRCHRRVAPSGKKRFLCDSVMSPSCPACLPREGTLWGRGVQPTQRPPLLALGRAYPLTTSPSLLGRTAQESRELGAGTAA